MEATGGILVIRAGIDLKCRRRGPESRCTGQRKDDSDFGDHPARKMCESRRNPSINQVYAPCHSFQKARIVSNHANGFSLIMQLIQKVHDGLTIPGVEIPGRLIGQQQRGPGCDSSGNCNALLLAAGELRWIVVCTGRELNLLQFVHRDFAALLLRDPLIEQGQLDIFDDPQVADQIKGLEYEADFTVAQLRPLI